MSSSYYQAYQQTILFLKESWNIPTEPGINSESDAANFLSSLSELVTTANSASDSELIHKTQCFIELFSKPGGGFDTKSLLQITQFSPA